MTSPCFMLKSVRWLDSDCQLCRSSPLNALKLTSLVNVNFFGQFGFAVFPVICTKCGLTYLSRRWDDSTYDKFYNYVYDSFYRIDNFPEIGTSGVTSRYEEIGHHIAKFLDFRPSRIVDIGGGSGLGALTLAKMFNISEVDVIEAGKLRLTHSEIPSNITISYYPSLTLLPLKVNTLFVSRHTIEHFLHLHDDISFIREAMHSSDLLFASTPDALDIRRDLRDYSDSFEYFFRVPHVVYYNEFTLRSALSVNRLSVIDLSSVSHELRVLAKATDLSCVLDQPYLASKVQSQISHYRHVGT